MTLISLDQIKREMYGAELDGGYISDDVYDLLPNMLRDACNVFERRQDKEAFLVAALPVCSTLMRGARIAVKQGKKGLNLAVWIHSSFAAGKGIAGMADNLLEGVKIEAAKRQRLALEDHRNEMDEFNTRLALVKKEREKKIKEKKHDLPPLPIAPPKPPKEDITLALYGHTKTLRDWVAENEGNVLFIDTEADSLNKKGGEYGDLRILFKQGIENEKSSNAFMSTGLQEWRSYISILITATDDQLVQFIQGPQDGLFSRFLFYGFEGDDGWVSSRPVDGEDYTSKLQRLQPRYASLYDRVREAAPTVTFTTQQWDDHDEEFAAIKEAAKHTHTALGGSTHRLGHFRLRIAAMLSIMRSHRSTMEMDQAITCDEKSWTASRLIIHRFVRGMYDTWSLYHDEQLPTDQQHRGADFEAARCAAAKEAKRLRGENLKNIEIFDRIQADTEFTAFTRTWSEKKTHGSKKTAVSRLLTYLQP